MKTVLLLVLIVSAIAIVGLLWRSRRVGSAISETTGPPLAAGGQAATDAGRHRNTSVATEAGAPLLPDGRPGGAHRA